MVESIEKGESSARWWRWLIAGLLLVLLVWLLLSVDRRPAEEPRDVATSAADAESEGGSVESTLIEEEFGASAESAPIDDVAALDGASDLELAGRAVDLEHVAVDSVAADGFWISTGKGRLYVVHGGGTPADKAARIAKARPVAGGAVSIDGTYHSRAVAGEDDHLAGHVLPRGVDRWILADRVAPLER
ncbi:MAG: hypothetical protein ACFBQW_00335 [Sphingomonadaceae bacterium]